MAVPDNTDRPVPWHESLMWRVVLLCAVLLVCLLAAISIISRHFFSEVAREMDAHAVNMARHIETELRLGKSLDEIEPPERPGEEITLYRTRPEEAAPPEQPLRYEVSKEGRVYVEFSHLFNVDGDWILLTSRMAVAPQTEILRAFKRPYLAAVTAVFILTLGLMVYFIVRILRPITTLSDTCAEISRGNLKDVEIRDASGEIRALEHTFNRMVSALKEKEVVEANLRQAQRLSALGSLAAGVAHDVRNPLNAIKLLSSHALDTLADTPGTEASARHLRTIRQEVDRLEDIVSRFLSLAKESEIQPEPVVVDALLADCVELLKADAERREVRLVADLRAGETRLMLDPKQWRRAVLNVLINALEATPPGGRVRMFSRLTDSVCEIEVRDDGPGMTREVEERVFDPYFTTKETGTGLGLSITRGIVEEHGGTIRLTSALDQGCQVLISVPLEGRKL